VTRELPRERPITTGIRIGLGCMRLSTEAGRDDDTALATIHTALDGGIRLFDTARAYARDESELGHNERLIARAWRARSRLPDARITTKCGMRREGGAWVADGRAKRIAEDAHASAEALSGIPIDILFLHAPDPSVSLSTTARALARVQQEGLVRSVGVSNVSRKQLEEIAAHAPIAAIQIALGAYDEQAVRSGVVSFCLERGIELFAHSPLGGPDRAARLARDSVLGPIARRHGVGAADVFLAYLLAVRPEIVPVVGARRVATIDRIVTAAKLALDDAELLELDRRFTTLGALRRPPVFVAAGKEVVMLMGVPGAGKSRLAERYSDRGFERLNRDLEGGTLRGIAQKLDERLSAGMRRIVLDNTYVTRAARHDVVRIAQAHGAEVHCVFLETPLAQAQINVVGRMLHKFGRLLDPGELESMVRAQPAALAPRAVFRMNRDLEPPALDEGFSTVEVRPFAREHGEGGQPSLVLAFDALGDDRPESIGRVVERMPAATPCLIYAWKPDAERAWIDATRGSALELGRSSGRVIEVAVCSHAAGPPICWCRPPLPGLILDFAYRNGVDLRASSLVGVSAADRSMARALDMSFVEG
jgi:aryl-alcohol dehydrogenase-like predicted oxidoreductase/adenylate kinase family enzyme